MLPIFSNQHGLQTMIKKLNPNAQTVYVIGDKFVNFSNGDSVLTYHQVLQSLPTHDYSNTQVVIGQGLNAHEVDRVIQIFRSANPASTTEIVEHVSRKVDKSVVHKTVQENVLISEPYKYAELSFAAALVIDDDCLEMSDHQSGDHIQGTLLIEASRQMFMACTQRMIVGAGERKIQYTLENMRVTFSDFVFPICTDIDLTYTDAVWKKYSGYGTAVIQFSQLGKICCEVSCSGKAFPDNLLNLIEARSALQARKQISGLVGDYS